MINLDLLYTKQKELDEEIFSKHNIDYASTVSSRTVALFVEIGEFANETRAFKFWSLKPSSPKDVVIEEYSDALHFFLSLGLSDGNKLENYSPKTLDEPLNELLLKLYQAVNVYSSLRSQKNYETAFKLFLDIGHTIHFSDEDIMDAYLKKLDVNHKRQENNY